MLDLINHCFSFKDRAMRSEIWLVNIAAVLIFLVVTLVFGLIVHGFNQFHMFVIDTSIDPRQFSPMNFFVTMIMNPVTRYMFYGYLGFVALIYIGMLATKVRRLHDLNFSGWWMLLIWFISALPSILQYLLTQFPEYKTVNVVFFLFGLSLFSLAFNLICLVFLYFVRGTKGPNKYGRDEKQIIAFIKQRGKEVRAQKKAQKLAAKEEKKKAGVA